MGFRKGFEGDGKEVADSQLMKKLILFSKKSFFCIFYLLQTRAF